MTAFHYLVAGLFFALSAAQESAPQRPVVAASSSRRAHGTLPWFAGSYEELGAKARDEKRAVMIFLWADGNRWCPRLEDEALSDAKLVAALEGVLVWNADAEQGSGKMLAGHFGIAACPVLLFFDNEGRAIDRIDGYLAPARCGAEIARIFRNEGTASDLQRQVAQHPDDLELRTRWAAKLEGLGEGLLRDQQIEEIRKRDLKRTSLPMRRELYATRLATIQEHFERTREINPGPLVRFLEEERHPELLYEGYSALSAMHLQRSEELEQAQQLEVARSKRSDLRATLTKAAAYLPENPAVQVGFALDTVATLAKFPGELSDADRALCLRLSAAAVALLPEEARTHGCAALASFFNGDKAGAASALQRARDLEPDNPEWPSLAQSMGL